MKNSDAPITGCCYIDDYIHAIRSGKRKASKRLILGIGLVERKLTAPGIIIDAEKIARAKVLIEKYFDLVLMDWELFVLALIHCYYEDDTLVFTEYLIVIGRGNGKTAFIAALCWYLTTGDHGIQGYNVDIIANSEDQSKMSFDDIYDMLERHAKKLKRFFYWTKEEILSLRTRSKIRFNSSNARTKDGKRSACLVFDEEHEYENDSSIRVFQSGFGKRKHTRTFKITTNGYVRDGVLDKDLEIANAILAGEHPESRTCPLIYEADSDTDIHNEDMWEKACPSLTYLPVLLTKMREDYMKMVYDKSVELDFYTKRMNLPRSNMEIAVTEWDNIAATKRSIPENMEGWQCTVGIDYASMRDWASVNFHFKRDEQRFDISRSWICLKNPELSRIKAPWDTWDEVTPVDDVEIAPELLTEYIAEMAQRYPICKLALDNFRYALLKKALAEIGFDASDRKNIYLVRPSDIMKVQPVIDSLFNRQLMTWGDTPSLRWATNNTKLVRYGKTSRRTDRGGDQTDTGNYYYAKIEGKSRKTDPFMALVASVIIEDSIPEAISNSLEMGVIV